MAIKTPRENLIIMPKEVAGKLRGASAEELKTLIYLFAEPESSVSDCAREVGITVAQAEAAVAFWRGAGIFEESSAKGRKKTASDSAVYRNYDSETLSSAVENNADFALVCRFAGERLGKQLNKNDLSSLFYLFDYVGLPAPVICGITEYCCAKEKKSVQYVFKKSLALYDEGIDSYDKLEEYLARMEAINGNIGKLRRLFGMGERELTAKEKKLYGCWFGEWSFSFEMVKLAYETTVDTKGSLNVSYMNGILRRWHESGFETEEDVKNGESGKPKGTPDGTRSSFDADEFIEAALAKGFD